MTPSPPSTAPPLSEKTKQLNLFDVLCLGTNAIVGSGIYVFPGTLAAQLGPASPLAFGVCGALCCVIGLCFVEAAGMFGRSGGPYVYTDEAFGPMPGYLVGWTCWAAAVLSWAAVANAIPPYLGHLLPAPLQAFPAVAVVVGITVALGAINYTGVKPGAYILDLLTVIKLLPLLVLLGLGLAATRTARLVPFAPLGLGALPKSTYLAMFAFQGFEVVPVPAGETRSPRKTAPVALIGSLLISTLLYMGLQLAAVGSTPDLAGAEEPLALMGRTLLGEAGAKLVAAAAVVSMVGFCAGVALAGPRYLEALALDRHLPQGLARRHPRFATPSRCVLLTTGVSAALAFVLDFNRLVDLAVLTVGAQYLATSLAIPALRRKMPQLGRAFRLPGGPLIPLCSVAVTLWFGAQASLMELAWFSGLVGVGVVVWGVSRVWQRA